MQSIHWIYNWIIFSQNLYVLNTHRWLQHFKPRQSKNLVVLPTESARSVEDTSLGCKLITWCWPLEHFKSKTKSLIKIFSEIFSHLKDLWSSRIWSNFFDSQYQFCQRNSAQIETGVCNICFDLTVFTHSEEQLVK